MFNLSSLFKKKSNKLSKMYWKTNIKFPENDVEIVVVTVDGDVYSGRYDGELVSMIIYEFIGMPMIEWSHVKLWMTKSEFKTMIKNEY